METAVVNFAQKLLSLELILNDFNLLINTLYFSDAFSLKEGK